MRKHNTLEDKKIVEVENAVTQVQHVQIFILFNTLTLERLAQLFPWNYLIQDWYDAVYRLPTQSTL